MAKKVANHAFFEEKAHFLYKNVKNFQLSTFNFQLFRIFAAVFKTKTVQTKN